MSDAELVRQCLQGDNAGFDALVKTYQKQVYYFCYRMLGSAEEAEDASQQSFVKAYNALDRSRGCNLLLRQHHQRHPPKGSRLLPKVAI